MSFATYSLDDVAQSLACTTRWLTEQIRSGRFRARKIGRHWRMTDSDVAAALDACANDPLRPAADADVMPIRTSLTPRSHRRVIGKMVASPGGEIPALTGELPTAEAGDNE